MSHVQSVTGTGRAAASARGSGRHLGVALLVIATAQLMVVLDSTVVNVALPHIQRALGFSGAGLEWVVNAYALAFGGLLLLGGRAGDLLGRRRMFVTGLLLFSAASLAGGFATSQAWLLAARAVQGAGGAIVAPAALALIVTTFPEGPPRSRAMGVYAAMSVGGGAAGLLAGGLLVTYASWRWVLFVNVPIGIAAALAALVVLPGAAGQPGRFDLPGAVTGTGGVAALVYGLSSATTSPDGTSHWGDSKVAAALAAAAVLLAAFAVIEARSRHALLPTRLLRNRNRLGAYLIMLGVGTAVFGVFFFITLFVQDVWGYSALRTGVAFLPLTVALLAASRCRYLARAADRRLAAAADRFRRLRRGPVLAVEDDGAQHLHGRAARPDPASPGPGLACCSSRCRWSPWPGWPTRTPGSPPACSTPAGKWAAPSAWRCWAPWPGRWSLTAPGPPQLPVPRPGRRRGGRPTSMRWRSASTGPSWSPPASRCSSS